LLEVQGRYRLIQWEEETLYRMYGYQPAPELFVTRRLEINVFGFWFTVHQYTYRVPTSQWIPDVCFGEKQDYTNDWPKVRLLSIDNYMETKPVYETKIGKSYKW
jgi:hypothetical protein